ncbi:MAG: alpha amylase C-terminal domain-containing protein, partial [Deltaproteobacteria bacterium]
GYRVLFSDNHDKAGGQHNREKGYPNSRLASRIDSNNPTSWIARKKNILGGLLPLTAPGVPMLFMGQELQASGIFADTNPLSWVQAGQQHRIFRAHRDLLNLRAGLPALQNTNVNSADAIIDPASGLCSYRRRGGSASEDVFVVLNLPGVVRSNVSLAFPSSGDWFVRFNSDWNVYGPDFGNVGSSSNQVTVDSGLFGLISVAPWSGLIFARTPASPSITIEDADNDGMPDGWENLYGVLNPQEDADGDGITNFREYQLGFDPSVTNATTVAGAFNQWDPAGAAMKATSTLNQLHYLYVTEEALTNQPIKFLLSGEWHGASPTAGISATPGTNNIFYDVPKQGYVYFTFNTDTKA